MPSLRSRDSESPDSSRASSSCSFRSDVDTDELRKKWNLPRSRSRSRSLTREEIDDIINSDFQTDYTYADSISYRKDGTVDYIHPRMHRPRMRFGAYNGDNFNNSRFRLQSTKPVYIWGERPSTASKAFKWIYNLFLALLKLFMYAAGVVWFCIKKAFKYVSTVLFPTIFAPFYALVASFHTGKRTYRAVRFAHQDGLLKRTWDFLKGLVFSVVSAAAKFLKKKDPVGYSPPPVSPIQSLYSPRLSRRTIHSQATPPVNISTPRGYGDVSYVYEKQPVGIFESIKNFAKLVFDYIALAAYVVSGWTLGRFHEDQGQLKRRGRPPKKVGIWQKAKDLARSAWAKILEILAFIGAVVVRLVTGEKEHIPGEDKLKRKSIYSPNRSRSPAKTRRQTLAGLQEADEEPVEQPSKLKQVLSTYFWLYYGGLALDLLKKLFWGNETEPSLVRKGFNGVVENVEDRKNWLPVLFLLLLLIPIGFYTYDNVKNKNRDVITALRQDTADFAEAFEYYLPPLPTFPSIQDLKKRSVDSVSATGAYLKNGWSSAAGYASETAKKAKDSTLNAGKFVQGSGENAFHSLYNGIHGAGAYVFGSAYNGGAFIASSIYNAHLYAYGALKDLAWYSQKGIVDGVHWTANKVYSVFAWIPRSVSKSSGFLTDSSKSIAAKSLDLAKNVKHTGANGVYYIYDNGKSAVIHGYNGVSNGIYHVYDATKNGGIFVYDGAANIVYGGYNGLKNGLGKGYEGIGNGFGYTYGAVKNATSYAYNGFLDVLTWYFEKCGQILRQAFQIVKQILIRILEFVLFLLAQPSRVYRSVVDATPNITFSLPESPIRLREIGAKIQNKFGELEWPHPTIGEWKWSKLEWIGWPQPTEWRVYRYLAESRPSLPSWIYPKKPEFSWPAALTFSFPEIRRPTFPKFSLPEISFPEVHLPKISVPQVSLPKMPQLPKVDTSRIYQATEDKVYQSFDAVRNVVSNITNFFSNAANKVLDSFKSLLNLAANSIIALWHWILYIFHLPVDLVWYVYDLIPTKKPQVYQEVTDGQFGDNHPLVLKLRVMMESLLKAEQENLEKKFNALLASEVAKVENQVDQRTDSLRSDYEVRLAELLPKHQSELRAEIENFARSIRQELAIQLKSTERTEKSLEVQALHSEIEKLKNDLSKRSEGLEEDIYSKISKILLQLDENQNKRLDEYAERLEKKLKNAQADPNEALAALHEQVEKFKKEIKVNKNVDESQIAKILDELMKNERKAIQAELTEIENRLEKKSTQSATVEKQLDQKFEQFMHSILGRVNEQSAQIVDELNRLRREHLNVVENLSTKKNVLAADELRREHQHSEDLYMSRVKALIKEYIERYDADKTGIPDYALESSGGSIIGIGCTQQYQEKSRLQSIFGYPLFYSNYGPRTVIQRKGNGATAGVCWAYVGGKGQLKIKLSQPINVTSVSYEHLPITLAPDGQIKTAPKEFNVWVYKDEDSKEKHLLGAYVYDEHGEALQMFQTQFPVEEYLTQVIELETESNYGAHVTCLYRFRVHGRPQQP
uniref:SUN domain-containing protein n=1 Tax=Bursaphelenchus xylophilus TaxID=6326 RepID=A0A1I7SEE2_BURXY